MDRKRGRDIKRERKRERARERGRQTDKQTDRQRRGKESKDKETVPVKKKTLQANYQG